MFMYEQFQTALPYQKGVTSLARTVCFSSYRLFRSSQQRSENFIKKRLQPKSFPVNISAFLRTPILKNFSSGCFCLFKSSWLAALKKFQNLTCWSTLNRSSNLHWFNRLISAFFRLSVSFVCKKTQTPQMRPISRKNIHNL